ncbi:MAG: DUF1214 domain-containing protein [Actinomycetota bacterium]
MASDDPGSAFRDLLARLGDMAEVVDREAADPVERAEGYRHLGRLLSACQEWFVEKADPRRPAFTRVLTPWRKFIGDNPDTIYDVAPVAAGHEYRLRGERNDAVYLGVTVYGRDESGNVTVLAQATDDEFVAHDGSFDLAVGGDGSPSDEARLAVPDGAESLWVRQYRHDPDDEAAVYSLHPTEPAGPPPALDEPSAAAALRRTTSFMTDTLEAVATVSRMMAGSPNTPLMDGAEFDVGDDGDEGDELEDLLHKLARTSHPTPDNRYAGVWFELEPREALVVTGTPPPGARYWGLQLANRWQESLDYLSHRVCLNDDQIALEPDGTYRVVVSAQDPGLPNWLDTAGHRSGMVNVRALLADDLETPNYEVVPVDSL